jgi:hypothetical protein
MSAIDPASVSPTRSLVRQIWQFLTQPTESIAILPPSTLPDAGSALDVVTGRSSSVSSVASSLPLASSASAAVESESARQALWEAAGIVGALIACQAIQYGWRKYNATDEEEQAKQRSQSRISELTSRSVGAHAVLQRR